MYVFCGFTISPPLYFKNKASHVSPSQSVSLSMLGLLAEASLILLSVCVTRQIHLLTLLSELCQQPAQWS